MFEKEIVADGSSNLANEQLARLGYQNELPRRLSMFSVMGLSFAIMVRDIGSPI